MMYTGRTMNNVLFIILVILFAGLMLFVVPRFLMKRAISSVIHIFQRQSALDARNAKTLDELGLRPRTFMEGMFRRRDYKPHALELLRRAGIVLVTEDDKLYLSEDKLASSGLYKRKEAPRY